jgi:hypothetical protein
MRTKQRHADAPAKVVWGIVAYHGNVEDPALFDGWYSTQKMAERALDCWCRELPGRHVVLVNATV